MSEGAIPIKKAIPIIVVAWILSLVTTLALVYVAPSIFPIKTAQIADEAIITAKLADGTVTSAKILDGTITAADLADGAIIIVKVADGAVARIYFSVGFQLQRNLSSFDHLQNFLVWNFLRGYVDYVANIIG